MGGFKIFFLDHRSIYINSLGDALAQLGNKVFYHPNWKMNEIEASIAYFQPDILLTVGSDAPLEDPALDLLPDICRKYNLFHLYWATEDKIHFQRWSLPFISRIQPDYVWTIHPDCVELYKQIGVPASYLNFACNMRLFPAKTKQSPEWFDVSFVGTTHLGVETFRYTSLQQLLVPLIKEQQKVNIWGYGWNEDSNLIAQTFGITIPADWIHDYLPYKQTVQVYHHSKILLGVQNADDQVTQRTFEILGSGGFMIASKTKELSRLFRDGVEIVLSDSPEQTKEYVAYYLQHPQKRYEIGQMARQKVMAEHTYSHRILPVWTDLDNHVKKKRGGR